MQDSSDDSARPGAAPVLTLARSRKAPVDLVDVAAEIQHADEMLGAMTTGKLQVIADQIRKLQDQARTLLEQAHTDALLHRAACPFHRRAGHVYHLYCKEDGSTYFSMLSPEDWRGVPPHAFEGSYRLESDMSWTPVERMAERDAAEGAIRKMLCERGDDR